MEGFALPTIEARFPMASKKCISRCPLLKSFLNSLGELDSAYSSIANRVASDDTEAEMREIYKIMPSEIAQGIDLKGSIIFNRTLGAEILESIDSLRQVCEQEIRDVTEGCDKPLDVIGTDCSGRSMGVFVCRSVEAPDGESAERANVFRYPQY